MYEQYLHNIARSSLILDEKKEDLTNIGFINKVTDLEKSFVEGVTETVVFEKLTDEELAKREIEAIEEQAIERNIKNGGTDKEIN